MTEELLSHHHAQLTASGLSPEMIATLHEKGMVYSLTDLDHGASLLNRGSPLPSPGLAFSYPDGSLRLRLDTPYTISASTSHDHDFTEHLKEPPKSQRYISPTAQRNGLYIWPELNPQLMDPDVPLYFVEGEKKALAAISKGIATVGAGGVYMFYGVEDNTAFHSDLDSIPTDGRDMICMFDSDLMTNANVTKAAVKWYYTAKNAGGIPHICILSDDENGNKRGFDDMLAEGGSGKFWDYYYPMNPDAWLAGGYWIGGGEADHVRLYFGVIV